LSPQAELYSIGLWILAAIVITVTWHTKQLSAQVVLYQDEMLRRVDNV
jgi:hypothetical protein